MPSRTGRAGLGWIGRVVPSLEDSAADSLRVVKQGADEPFPVGPIFRRELPAVTFHAFWQSVFERDPQRGELRRDHLAWLGCLAVNAKTLGNLPNVPPHEAKFMARLVNLASAQAGEFRPIARTEIQPLERRFHSLDRTLKQS